jgi:hypothetical protein
VTPDQIAALIAPAPDVLGRYLAGLPEGGATWSPAAGEWSVNQVLDHLVVVEQRGFRGRAQAILAAPGEVDLKWVDAERPDPQARSLEELLGEFAATRAESVEWLRGGGDLDLTKAGIHPTVGRLTVGDVLHEWPYHDAAHLRQVLAIVQAMVWPDMGNAQKFGFS